MVKLKVEFACGTPPDLQKFIFGTKVLEDEMTLGESNVQREATLNLVPGSSKKLQEEEKKAGKKAGKKTGKK